MKLLPEPGRKRNYFYTFIAFIFFVSVFTVVGDKGFLDAYGLKRELAAIRAEEARLGDANRALKAEVELLKNDRRYIARIARTELGMIGQDEVLYMFER